MDSKQDTCLVAGYLMCSEQRRAYEAYNAARKNGLIDDVDGGLAAVEKQL
jgi:hypothetical protein